MHTIKVETSEVSKFMTILQDVLNDAQYTNVLLCWVGANGWCPDCEEVKEPMKQWLEEALSEDQKAKSVMLVIDVERAAYFAPDTWTTLLYRSHPQLKLKTVPTIMIWDRKCGPEDKQMKRLEEWEVYIPQ
jgi:Eukaryotic protein of unknown function (DUF953)